jgi:hypothetical protein
MCAALSQQQEPELAILLTCRFWYGVVPVLRAETRYNHAAANAHKS